MTTISVVTCCYGIEYAEFIPRWWQSVLALNRKPDEIILGIDKGDPTGLSRSIPEGIKARIIVLPEGGNVDKWDFAVRKAKSKWWCYAPIDDEFLPEALDEVDKADEEGADFLVDSIIVRDSGFVAKGDWNTKDIATRLPIPGWPPTTLAIYKKLARNDYKFGDWAFQIDAAATGAKPYFANTKRIIWDSGVNRMTLSNPKNDDHNFHLNEIAKYARSKGF
jgi:hypothetical protein